MTSYAAHLRVYEPLAAFPPAERDRLRAYLADGAAPSTVRGPELRRAAGLRALAGVPATYLPELPEHAYVADLDGVTLVCPWRTRVRAWEALGDFLAELPAQVADAVVPRDVAEAAQDALTGWRVGHPELRTHVLDSPWQVPVRWFVLVDAGERELRAGVPGAGGAPPGQRTGRSLVYRTAMSRARRRCARALSVLRRTVGDQAATAGVEELGRWLEEFHPRALVELDYGGLVHLLDDAALAADDSAGDVAVALAALAEGRGEDAGQAYARVTSRMQALQSVESAS